MSFQIRTGLLTSDFGSWRHEEKDIILTMLTPRQCAAHLVVFMISVGRDPKIPTTSFNGQNLTPHGRISNSRLNGRNSTLCLHGLISTDSFLNLQILRIISSGHDIIHTPDPFPVGAFIGTMVIVISFAHERKTAPNDYAPELKRLE